MLRQHRQGCLSVHFGEDGQILREYLAQLIFQAADIHGSFFLHSVVFPKKRLDRGNLIIWDDRRFQAGPQPQKRDPLCVIFVIMNIADIHILVGMGHDGIENKNLQSGIPEPVIQRQMVNASGLHVDPSGQLICLPQSQNAVHCALHRAIAAVQNFIRSSYDFLCGQRYSHQTEISADVDSH